MVYARRARSLRPGRVSAGRATAKTPPRPLGARIVRSNAVVGPHTDRGVLVDVGTGWRTTLDEFGRRVWMQLGEQPTLPLLVMRLRDDGTSAERLAEDVTQLLARWRAMSLITWR